MKHVLLTLTLTIVVMAAVPVEANGAPPNWDVTGTWTGVSYEIYAFTLIIETQDESGAITGTMEYDVGNFATITGSVSGNDIVFTRDDVGSTYAATLTGTVGATSMSGTFSDTNGTEGDWEAIGTAAWVVDIDIKPGSDRNPVNLGSKGVIPVAILSSDAFDATTVDPETVDLGGAAVAVKGKKNKLMAHWEDVNDDGLIDLLVQVDTKTAGSWTSGTVFLNATTYDGLAITGSDEVVIVPQKK